MIQLMGYHCNVLRFSSLVLIHQFVSSPLNILPTNPRGPKVFSANVRDKHKRKDTTPYRHNMFYSLLVGGLIGCAFFVGFVCSVYIQPSIHQ